MKKHILISQFLLFIFCSLCLGLPSAFSVDFIELVHEFAGKGSTEGRFGKNIHLAFDKQHIYVSDTENRLIQKLSATGEFLFQFPEVPESPDNILRKPGHLAVDSAGMMSHKLSLKTPLSLRELRSTASSLIRTTSIITTLLCLLTQWDSWVHRVSFQIASHQVSIP